MYPLGPLWWRVKLEIFRDLVMGVMHCHRNKVYHGDLKGENVLIDRYFVPKLTDFGLSFRKVDLDYIRQINGCSFFWASPEIEQGISPDDDDDDDDVLHNPYPCDVYSLGMVLVEMSLDGKVPPEFSDSLVINKCMGGPLIPFQIPPDMEVHKAPLQKLEKLVEECCKLERKERISLEDCLMCIEEAYADICAICSSEDPNSAFQELLSDFKEAEHYIRKIIPKLQVQFPSIPHCIFLQVHRNMMLNPEGELLMHAFCRLDFWEGVQYIIQKGYCSFEPHKEIPYISLISVRSGSLQVLKFLAKEWADIMAQELVLVHEQPDNRPDVLRFLLFDLGMAYDTWGRENQPLMPIHKFAKTGRKEMIQVVLDRAGVESDHINAYIDPYKCRTPLYYAVKEDDMDTVSFLLENGAAIYSAGDGTILDGLFLLACRKGCLRVVTGLLELAYTLQEECGCNKIAGIPLTECEESYRILKRHVQSTGTDLLKLACQRGREKVFQSLIWIFVRGKIIKVRSKLKDDLFEYVCKWGSREMLQLLLEQTTEEMWQLRSLTDPQASMVDVLLQFASKHENTEVKECLLEVALEQGKKADDKIIQVYAAEAEEDDNDEDEEEKKRASAFRVIKEGNMEELQSILAGMQPAVPEFLRFCAKQCCVMGNLELLKMVLGCGDGQQEDLLHSLLHWSSYYGAMDVVRYLLRNKKTSVQVDARADVFGLDNTALLCAAMGEKREVVAALLQAGADANAVNSDGFTAMDFAILDRDHKMVESLIQFHFDTGQRDRNNRRYMDLIASYRDAVIIEASSNQ